MKNVQNNINLMTATQDKTPLRQRHIMANIPTQKSRIMSTELQAVDSSQLCRSAHIIRRPLVVLARENEHFYSKRPRLETVLGKKRRTLACLSDQTRANLCSKIDSFRVHKAS